MLRKCIIALALGLLLAAPASARMYGDGTMLVSPNTFILDHIGLTVSIHTEVKVSSVLRSSVVLHGVNGASITPLYITSDSRGNLVAKFASDDIKRIVEVPRTELSLSGFFNSGETFTLEASIAVR